MSADSRLLLDAVRRAVNPAGGEQPQPVVIVRPKGEGVVGTLIAAIAGVALSAWVVMLCVPVVLPHGPPSYWRVVVGLIALREIASVCRPDADTWSVAAAAWRKSGRSL
jgi:hypothetical protein